MPAVLRLAAHDRRLWRVLALASVAVGVALRLHRFADNPALWMDEAFLAINIIEKPLSDLFGALQFLQSAPPGFLLLEKTAELSIGDAEWSLRLVSLFASLASVPCFGYVAWRVLAPQAAVLAIALFATAEPLLLHAAEVKHYSTDLAVTTLLLALYLWAVEGSAERRRRRLVILGLVTPIALSLSFPAIFVLAGVVTALGVRGLEARARPLLLGALAVAAVAIASFAAVYAVAAQNANRIRASVLGDEDVELSVGRLKSIENAWWTFINPGGFDNETNSIAALLALLGVLALVRWGALDRLALFALPLALAGVADAVSRYPLGGRFSIFLVPLLIVLVARGAQALVAWSRRPFVVATAVAIFLLAPPIALAGYHLVETPARGDIKPVLQHVIDSWQQGDALYVFPDTQYQLRYYSECDHCSLSNDDFPWPTRLAPPAAPGAQRAPALESIPPTVVMGSRDEPDTPIGDVGRLPAGGRVWLLTSTQSLEHHGLSDELLLVNALEQERQLLEEFRAREARVYLFDRRGT